MLTQVPLDNWKTYLRWMIVNAAAPGLSRQFADENFKFFGTYLSGQKEKQPDGSPRSGDDNTLGEALGRIRQN